MDALSRPSRIPRQITMVSSTMFAVMIQAMAPTRLPPRTPGPDGGAGIECDSSTCSGWHGRPFQYQWSLAGNPNPGAATGHQFTRVSAQSSDAGGGLLSRVRGNIAGSYSKIATSTVLVRLPFSIALDVTTEPGRARSRSPRSPLARPLGYVWQFNNQKPCCHRQQ